MRNWTISKPKESDWKRYRNSLARLSERYLEKRNAELARALQDPEKTATERF